MGKSIRRMYGNLFQNLVPTRQRQTSKLTRGICREQQWSHRLIP